MIIPPNSTSLESDVAGTLEEHWRKGIPTLVLLVLATVVSCYYWMLVKPSMQKRYSTIIQSNLKTLGMDGIDANDRTDANGNSDISNAELSSKKRIAILKETQLALRRLVGWNNNDDSVHYRYAIVSQALSSSYLREAISNGTDGTSQFFGIAKTEQQNATGAMERVRKLNNAFAPNASLWLVKGKIEENQAVPNTDLLLIEKTVRPLLENDSIASSAKTLLAQVLVERALRQSSELDHMKRFELLAEADQLLRSASTNNVKALSLQAEAIALVDTAKAQEFANKALQEFWSTRDAETQTAESLASVFRCLLIIGSLKEGQVFLSEQLQQLSAMDQPKFRALTAAAALRHVVSIALGANASAAGALNTPMNTKAANGSAIAEVVLSLAIQLNPESPELMKLLQSISELDNVDPIVSWLMRELALNGTASDGPRKGPKPAELGISPFLTAVVGLGRVELDESTTTALAIASKLSPAFGVAASRLAFQMANSDTISSEVAFRWFQTINSAAPDILVAWSDRANLHLKNKQPLEAIKCLEFLLDKLPDNAQILEALDAANMQLKLGE